MTVHERLGDRITGVRRGGTDREADRGECHETIQFRHLSLLFGNADSQAMPKAG
jgi:hypothetical protein